MKKSQTGTIIIWSIGLLFLTGFLFLGFFNAEWNWGLLFFVVAFFGWGLQRSIGRKESPPHPAVKFLRNTTAAIVSGLAFFFVSIAVLMELGTEYHDNYEYYGQYPALYVIPGLVGLFFPRMLAWLVTKYKERVDFKHGWEVELQCPQCGHDGLPKCGDGRTPKPAEYAKNTGETPMICADVTCSQCGHDLKERAGEKLTELFKDVPKTTIGFLGVVLAILIILPVLPFILAVLIEFGAVGGWLANWFGWWFWPSLFAPAVIIPFCIYMMHPLIYACECGNPRFLFMGMLGRSYCFRCSSCSRLLRRGR
jgi:MFS family permease